MGIVGYVSYYQYVLKDVTMEHSDWEFSWIKTTLIGWVALKAN